MKLKSIILACMAAMLFSSPMKANAVEKTNMEILTLPFGTSAYAMDMAMESLFKEFESPISLLLKQTPGMMFVYRYRFENNDKMQEGKMPFYLYNTVLPVITYAANGLTPYEDYPDPDSRIIAVVNGAVTPYITFEDDIKVLNDMEGKKVGVAEKARPNQSILPNKPLFDKVLGDFEKVDWQYLGAMNSKDAILNGSIDVHMGTALCQLLADENGNFYTTKITPDPATMEVISSGTPYSIIDEDPSVVRSAYNPASDLVQSPVLLKAGSAPGLDKDVWVKGFGVGYLTHKDVSDEVVEEIVYTMYKNKERLAEYYEGFSYMTDSPYLPGTDVALYHPGVFKAMKRLGLALPDGVTVE